MPRETLDSSSFSSDALDLLRLLQGHAVKYLIVGGEAVIYYGHARLTGDIDIFYEITEANVGNMFSALSEFWAGGIPGLDSSDELLQEGLILQFGVPPNRIDLVNKVSGLTFQEAWPARMTVCISCGAESVSVHYLGLDDLVRNKRAAGRAKDLDDLDFLLRVRVDTGP